MASIQKHLVFKMRTTDTLNSEKRMSKVFSFEVPEFSNVFFESFFEVFGKSNSAKKCKKGTLCDCLSIHSVAK